MKESIQNIFAAKENKQRSAWETYRELLRKDDLTADDIKTLGEVVDTLNLSAEKVEADLAIVKQVIELEKTAALREERDAENQKALRARRENEPVYNAKLAALNEHAQTLANCVEVTRGRLMESHNAHREIDSLKAKCPQLFGDVYKAPEKVKSAARNG